MADDLDTFIAKVAYGATRGALTAWAEDGPAIVTATVQAWRRAMQATMVNAQQAPPDVVADLQKEIADATK